MDKGYISVNGLDLYYERHGEGGTPLVLLHGAFSAIGTSFGALLPKLAASREVIAFELQGHGHTADIDRPFALDTMADDIAAGLEQLGVARADIFGYSLGAGVALTLALRHTERVRKLVLASLAYSKAGYPPGFVEAMQGIKAEMFTGTPWQQEYASIAPRPDDFGKLLAKLKTFNSILPDFAEAELKAITLPVLLISGDADNASLEHMASFHRLLGGGVPVDQTGAARSWLLILPGTSHAFVPARADIIAPAVEAFLGVL